MEVRPATDAERPAAAERLCGNAERAVGLLRAFASRSSRFDPQDLLVAIEGNELRGVLFAQTLPARLADYCLAAGSVPDIEDALLTAAIAHSTHRGVCLVQAYLDPTADPAAYQRNGFHLATQIEHRQRRDGQPERHLGPILHFASQFDPVLFDATLLATYEGSLDAPEANVGATAAEVLDGYKSDVKRWLVYQGERPVGVLLLGEDDLHGEIEYFGVVPDARGKGIGSSILHHALSDCARRSITPVLVSVDARNTPARRVYDSFGFRVEQVQNLWLRPLP